MRLALATLFDRNYLARALVMARSLRRWMGPATPTLVALCLDAESLAYLRAHPEPGVEPLALAELEAADPGLAAVRSDRSRLEYYFTLSPCLPRYLLARGGLDAVVSLDADLWFLADPTPLLESLADRPLFITAHGFSPAVRRRALQTGRFNVSFQGFRDDATGRACLDQWRRQCLEWCGHRVDRQNARFADQRYLDSWPADFPGALTIHEPPRAGLAPWNLGRFPIGSGGDGPEPVFFHFHGVRFLAPDLAADNLWRYHVRLGEPGLQRLYAPYLRELVAAQAVVGACVGDDRPLHDSLRMRRRPWTLWATQTWSRVAPDGAVTHTDLSWAHPVQRLWRGGRAVVDRCADAWDRARPVAATGA